MKRLVRVSAARKDENEPKTLKSIAELFGISRERIRQIESDAIRKLRNPRNGKRLLKSMEGKIEMNGNLFECSVEDLLSLDLDEFVSLLSENQKLCPSVRLANFLETLEERNNAQTVGDLVKLSKEELLKFRNFGIKTFHELEDILIELELGLWSNKKFNCEKERKELQRQINYQFEQISHSIQKSVELSDLKSLREQAHYFERAKYWLDKM